MKQPAGVDSQFISWHFVCLGFGKAMKEYTPFIISWLLGIGLSLIPGMKPFIQFAGCIAVGYTVYVVTRIVWKLIRNAAQANTEQVSGESQ
jgi:hypothetical protein